MSKVYLGNEPSMDTMIGILSLFLAEDKNFIVSIVDRF
jgi:hypothetical protein